MHHSIHTSTASSPPLSTVKLVWWENSRRFFRWGFFSVKPMECKCWQWSKIEILELYIQRKGKRKDAYHFQTEKEWMYPCLISYKKRFEVSDINFSLCIVISLLWSWYSQFASRAGNNFFIFICCPLRLGSGGWHREWLC